MQNHNPAMQQHTAWRIMQTTVAESRRLMCSSDDLSKIEAWVYENQSPARLPATVPISAAKCSKATSNVL